MDTMQIYVHYIDNATDVVQFLLKYEQIAEFAGFG
jgi:hypothetical protein